MSSREIADLTGKQHQHVMRDTKRMLGDLGFDASTFGRIYLDGLNRQQTEYVLGQDLVITLLSGYSAPLRYRVVTRLHELENVSRQVVTIPQILPEALRFAALQAEENLQLQQVIAKQAPKGRSTAALGQITRRRLHRHGRPASRHSPNQSIRLAEPEPLDSSPYRSFELGCVPTAPEHRLAQAQAGQGRRWARAGHQGRRASHGHPFGHGHAR